MAFAAQLLSLAAQVQNFPSFRQSSERDKFREHRIYIIFNVKMLKNLELLRIKLISTHADRRNKRPERHLLE